MRSSSFIIHAALLTAITSCPLAMADEGDDPIKDNNPTDTEYEAQSGPSETEGRITRAHTGTHTGTVCVAFTDPGDGLRVTVSCGQSITFAKGQTIKGSLGVGIISASISHKFKTAYTLTSGPCEECAGYVCYEGATVTDYACIGHTNWGSATWNESKLDYASTEYTKRRWAKPECDPSCVDDCGCGDGSCDCHDDECCQFPNDSRVCDTISVPLDEFICIDGTAAGDLCGLPFGERGLLAESLDAAQLDATPNCWLHLVGPEGVVHEFDLSEPDPLRAGCEWDVNGDGSVNAGDVAELTGAIGEPACWHDFDGDGLVSIGDIDVVLDHLGDCQFVQHEIMRID